MGGGEGDSFKNGQGSKSSLTGLVQALGFLFSENVRNRMGSIETSHQKKASNFSCADTCLHIFIRPYCGCNFPGCAVVIPMDNHIRSSVPRLGIHPKLQDSKSGRPNDPVVTALEVVEILLRFLPDAFDKDCRVRPAEELRHRLSPSRYNGFGGFGKLL